jgi:hypothetical protein
MIGFRCLPSNLTLTATTFKSPSPPSFPSVKVQCRSFKPMSMPNTCIKNCIKLPGDEDISTIQKQRTIKNLLRFCSLWSPIIQTGGGGNWERKKKSCDRDWISTRSTKKDQGVELIYGCGLHVKDSLAVCKERQQIVVFTCNYLRNLLWICMVFCKASIILRIIVISWETPLSSCVSVIEKSLLLIATYEGRGKPSIFKFQAPWEKQTESGLTCQKAAFIR